ncbi:hypothetical protein C8F04DRAFT_1151881 [Mycena alexandri]|uniref:BTB domain-containing protein n=1 Tax=Mycena alexandri TaxID=1745969 RepID=A0AAD6S1U7_9AGAR|nr:hypothetical protein C8F04DRAFT_1151881 [Mycena alexandri]
MSSQPTKPQSTIKRSEIWYHDGTVVLQAQNTQFRVYFGFLAQHSAFFRDLQSLPQPLDQPAVDGCPIVELPDTVTDVEYLLKAVHSPLHYRSPLVGALIRLGRKYDFQELFNSAVERLAFENPTTFEGVDALLSTSLEYVPKRIIPYSGILFDIVTLARENNILSVLPCAYYRMVIKHTPERLFDGHPRDDGTIASLALLDLRRCIVGRDKLMKARFEPGYTLGWLKNWDHGLDCTDAPELHSGTGRSSAVLYKLSLDF